LAALDVENETSVITGAVTLINGFADRIEAVKGNETAIDLSDEKVAQPASDTQLVTPCASFEEWKRLRGSYIGGSDAAAILGLSPYRTIGEVWIEKVQARERLDDGDGTPVDPEVETRFSRWGKRLESVVLDEYQDVTGFEVRRPGLTLYRHPELPFIGGTLDGDVVTGHGDKRIVEGKTTDGFLQHRTQMWGPDGSDEVPDHYLIQLLVYLIVRRHEGFTLGDFAVLIGGNDFRIFHVAYDEELAKVIIQRLSEFWDLVVNRKPPPFDYAHANAVDLQRRIWNKVSGSVVYVPADYHLPSSDKTIVELIAERDDAAALKDTAEARFKMATAELMNIAADSARVEIDGMGGLALRRKPRAAYHVNAYDVEESIVLDVVVGNNNRREKRKELLDGIRKQISDGK
jgi:putative phage-type endonuclease